MDKNVPGLVMVAMRRISLERRQSNHEEAERLFKDYLEKTTSNKCRTFYAIKYTRYLQKVGPCLVWQEYAVCMPDNIYNCSF